MFNFTIENLWQSWLSFRKGKKRSAAIEEFSYQLENNLFSLHEELNNSTYQHGGYRKFIVNENKRRVIAVASVRDRVVHRLLYDNLVQIVDHRFIYDAWSCRKSKGLIAAIERAQSFAYRFPKSDVWRMDIKKFFDSVHHDTLLQLLADRNIPTTAFTLCKNIIQSYALRPGIGIPIGNLTSQIFANMYLNEFDRYVSHIVRPQCYMRYGDDAIFLFPTSAEALLARSCVTHFLNESLHLSINPKNDIVIPMRRGIKFLGVWIYSAGRRLVARVRQRISTKLCAKNVSSYGGLIKQHEPQRKKMLFDWMLYEKIIRKS